LLSEVKVEGMAPFPFFFSPFVFFCLLQWRLWRFPPPPPFLAKDHLRPLFSPGFLRRNDSGDFPSLFFHWEKYAASPSFLLFFPVFSRKGLLIIGAAPFSFFFFFSLIEVE